MRAKKTVKQMRKRMMIKMTRREVRVMILKQKPIENKGSHRLRMRRRRKFDGECQDGETKRMPNKMKVKPQLENIGILGVVGGKQRIVEHILLEMGEEGEEVGGVAEEEVGVVIEVEEEGAEVVGEVAGVVVVFEAGEVLDDPIEGLGKIGNKIQNMNYEKVNVKYNCLKIHLTSIIYSLNSVYIRKLCKNI